jgi:DNA mismatch repair protein MSH6
MESDSEGEDDDEQIFRPGRKNNRPKRRKVSPESDEEFDQDGGDAGYSDDGKSRVMFGIV